jgi:glutathione peroxidase-family protein
MGNMSYCRFENTYKDLQECYEALQDEGGVEGIEAEANEYEKPYIKRLIELCKDIVEDFEDELED